MLVLHMLCSHYACDIDITDLISIPILGVPCNLQTPHSPIHSFPPSLPSLFSTVPLRVYARARTCALTARAQKKQKTDQHRKLFFALYSTHFVVSASMATVAKERDGVGPIGRV